jgi:hypothetical protein
VSFFFLVCRIAVNRGEELIHGHTADDPEPDSWCEMSDDDDDDNLGESGSGEASSESDSSAAAPGAHEEESPLGQGAP